MDKKQASKLKIGELIVIWAESPDACGTITEKNWMAIKVEWDDAQVGVIHLDDCKDVSRFYGDKIVPRQRQQDWADAEREFAERDAEDHPRRGTAYYAGSAGRR